MTLQELRYIVAVAREQHFGRAAQKCFVSQPSLSVAVKRLEDELGVQLFERTKNDVVVTAIGRQVIAQAELALAEVNEVKRIAASGRDQLQGPLRLGVIHSIAPYLLPDLVVALRRQAPDMPLDVEENLTDNLDRMLHEGTIDLAILALPYSGTGIEVTPVYDEVFELIVPSGHPWSSRRQIAAAEVNNEELLLLSTGHCLRDQVLEACSRFATHADSGKQGNSLETLRSMVASGMGMTVVPATAMTPRFKNPLVKRVPFSAPKPKRTVVVASRQDFYRPRARAKLIEVLRALPLPVKALAS